MFAVPALMVGSIVESMTNKSSVTSTNEADLKKLDDEAIELCVTITFCLGIIFVRLLALF